MFDSLKVHPFAFVRKNNFVKDLTHVISDYVKTKSTLQTTISVKVNNQAGVVNVKESEIIYIESRKNHQYLFLDSQVNQLELRMTMGELEEKLDKDTFCRVHKGYLVNFGHVIRIDKDVISMSNGDNVYISRQKIKDVRSKYLTYVRIKGGLVF